MSTHFQTTCEAKRVLVLKCDFAGPAGGASADPRNCIGGPAVAFCQTAMHQILGPPPSAYFAVVGIHASLTEQNANEWAISTPESEERGNCIVTQEVSSQSKCWHTDFCLGRRLRILQDIRLHRTQVKEVRQKSRAITPSDAQAVPSTRYTGDALARDHHGRPKEERTLCRKR
jgi:hypothetical protein